MGGPDEPGHESGKRETVMKRRTGVLLAAPAGFGIATLLMSAAIYLGYCEACRTGAEEAFRKLRQMLK